MEAARCEIWHRRTSLMGRKDAQDGCGYLKEGWDVRSQTLVIW